MSLDVDSARRTVDDAFEREISPLLEDYVRIPCKSPHFDADWAERGEIDRAVALAEGWCRTQRLPDLRVEVVRLPGRTPVLLLELPGDCDATALLYGHLDKQPEMSGWSPGLGPWTPVRRGDRLYGRGGADDGYAVFASLLALRLLVDSGVPRPRAVVLIETCEESGSYDLPAYVEHLKGRIGDPGLVVCLDSGCGSYDQLWCTTSLRGIAAGVLRVRVLDEGVHSGDASGIVPSSFRIARHLLDRLEDAESGEIRVPELRAEIPPERAAQAEVAARALGDGLWSRFPFSGSGAAMGAGGAERILNRTWRPFLEVIGVEGVPPLESAGNVLRPETALKLSLRLPPTVDGAAALGTLGRVLEADPPYGARVSFEPDAPASGWNAPPWQPWLADSVERASQEWFGREAVLMGEGGTIPFMAMLGERFPHALFLITGVLGPEANAHGPNEFLHLPTAKRLTGCVARVLADFASAAS